MAVILPDKNKKTVSMAVSILLARGVIAAAGEVSFAHKTLRDLSVRSPSLPFSWCLFSASRVCFLFAHNNNKHSSSTSGYAGDFVSSSPPFSTATLNK